MLDHVLNPASDALSPSSEAKKTTRRLDSLRKRWQKDLLWGHADIQRHLEEAKYTVLEGVPRALVLAGARNLNPPEVTMMSRLKNTSAIVAKMQRFGEPLNSVLDIRGFRIVVPDEPSLNGVVEVVKSLWKTPTSQEMLLRNGALQFDWCRDYRLRSHNGLSSATSLNYDMAVHINRRAQFGICEIQIMTLDLYARAFLSEDKDEAHGRFEQRRKKGLARRNLFRRQK